MEHMYREMLKGFLRKKYNQLPKDTKDQKKLGKKELIEDLFDYFGFGDINDTTPTPDQVMVKLYKRDH